MTDPRHFHCGGRRLDPLSPWVMGIVNATPDSFSDGGALQSGSGEAFVVSVDKALRQAERFREQGAAIIDIGGESTRPGARPVSLQQELDRVMPVVQAICREIDLPVSVDTSRPEVIREAAAAGAVMINDVRALRMEGALRAAADTGMSICLMHMQGEPVDMQRDPDYGHRDVVDEVRDFLSLRIDAALHAGVAAERICIDPGFGFGKTAVHNFRLLNRLSSLVELGWPVLVGMSRKGMIGYATGRPVDQRLSGSVAAAVAAVMSGAQIVRCHDVAETVDALRICEVMRKEAEGTDNE